jgi:hypothetical protein
VVAVYECAIENGVKLRIRVATFGDGTFVDETFRDGALGDEISGD